MDRTVMRAAVGGTIRATAAFSPRLAGRIAFELWRRPMARGRVREVERTIHEAARVEVVDGIVTYAWGDGTRPVLLVHGWRSRASRYVGFVSRLLELGYSPVSYDGPGHGDSATQMGTILDHQRIITTLATRYGGFDGLIAHSMGVPFALYAVRHGVPLSRIVAISGIAEFGYLVDKFGAELGLGPAVKESLKRTIERRLFGGDPEIWAKFSVGPGDADLLVIHNDVDDVVDPAQAPILLASYGPTATFAPKTGLGHSRILADPAVITEAITFLASEDPRAIGHTSSDASGGASGGASGSDVAEGLDLSA